MYDQKNIFFISKETLTILHLKLYKFLHRKFSSLSHCCSTMNSHQFNNLTIDLGLYLHPDQQINQISLLNSFQLEHMSLRTKRIHILLQWFRFIHSLPPGQININQQNRPFTVLLLKKMMPNITTHDNWQLTLTRVILKDNNTFIKDVATFLYKSELN